MENEIKIKKENVMKIFKISFLIFNCKKKQENFGKVILLAILFYFSQNFHGY